jgi:hypothetical protein
MVAIWAGDSVREAKVGFAFAWAGTRGHFFKIFEQALVNREISTFAAQCFKA